MKTLNLILNKNLRLFSIAFLMLALALNITLIANFLDNKNRTGQVLSEQSQVTGIIYGCTLTLKALPEKRVNIPNYSTILTVLIYDATNNLKGEITTTTDQNGYATVDICKQGIRESGGNYNFRVRGYSHLMKRFPNISAFNTAGTTIDFSKSNTFFFLAGETSQIFDNKINSLDISTQIVKFYSNDYKNDLNQDQKVNSLDISNTITNFFKQGE